MEKNMRILNGLCRMSLKMPPRRQDRVTPMWEPGKDRGRKCLPEVLSMIVVVAAVLVPSAHAQESRSGSTDPTQAPPAKDTLFGQVTQQQRVTERRETTRQDIRLRIKFGASYFAERVNQNGRLSSGSSFVEPELSLSGGVLSPRSVFNNIRVAARFQLDKKQSTNIAAFTVSQVHQGIPSHSRVQSHVGYGLGLYRVMVDTPESDRKQHTLFGGFLVAGAEVDTITFEIKYHLVARVRSQINDATSSVNVNHLQFSVGFRFGGNLRRNSPQPQTNDYIPPGSDQKKSIP
jgi:hypothetical protein